MNYAYAAGKVVWVTLDRTKMLLSLNKDAQHVIVRCSEGEIRERWAEVVVEGTIGEHAEIMAEGVYDVDRSTEHLSFVLLTATIGPGREYPMLMKVEDKFFLDPSKIANPGRDFKKQKCIIYAEHTHSAGIMIRKPVPCA